MGSSYVYINVNDTYLTRAKVQYARNKDLDYLPPYFNAQMQGMIKERWARIRIDNTSEIGTLICLDAQKQMLYEKTWSEASLPFQNAVMSNQIAWCVVCFPDPYWAGSLFNMPANKQAQLKLWRLMMPLLRLNEEDPLKAWKEHICTLRQRCLTLNKLKIQTLCFKDEEKGTDLSLGLCEEAIWLGGDEETQFGRSFLANIPTEEVFTAPHLAKAQGRVIVTRPVKIMETQLEQVWFELKDGKVISWGAKKHKELLDKLFSMDENAVRLEKGIELVNLQDLKLEVANFPVLETKAWCKIEKMANEDPRYDKFMQSVPSLFRAATLVVGVTPFFAVVLSPSLPQAEEYIIAKEALYPEINRTSLLILYRTPSDYPTLASYLAHRFYQQTLPFVYEQSFDFPPKEEIIKEKTYEIEGIYFKEEKEKVLIELSDKWIKREIYHTRQAIYERQPKTEQILTLSGGALKKNRLLKALAHIKRLKARLEPWQALLAQVEDLKFFYELALEEGDSRQEEEIQSTLELLNKQAEQLIVQNYLNGELDSCDAFLTIQAGAGGTEACDWAAMLLRMYLRWAQTKNFKTKIVDYLEAEGGVKSAVLEIIGHNAYGYLNCETVFAEPILNDEIEVLIKAEDLRIDTYRASGAGGQHVNKTDSAVRITHLPTRLVVQCQNERSQHKNKETAMKLLKTKLYELYQKEQEAQMADKRQEKKDISWGNQIRSYVFHPYNLVKDHRSKHEVGNIQAVMDGVNGTGKTSTIAKLAHYFKQNICESLVLGAGDTFRAAASQQLKIWAEELELECIAQKPSTPPSAVVWDTLSFAKAKKKKIVLIDTAGYLHNKEHLVQELKKMSQVSSKVLKDLPYIQHNILILDANTGQNAREQSKVFSQTLTVSGIILSKFDGSSRSGVLMSICEQLTLPLLGMTIGEKKDQLITPFDKNYFLEKLLRT
ncbi:UNVERIFIED_CONTAM: hypothetical protein PYX00_010994 [Menopon gallinae]|uniref:Prokaryotic-type class I peptide chain release factors domain-containing protein n=1 Tax=Menopon gallinae TaxID=328185 RepID=A0AAW2H739_9NEOP